MYQTQDIFLKIYKKKKNRMIMRKREKDGEIAIHSYRGRLIKRRIRNGRKYKKIY